MSCLNYSLLQMEFLSFTRPWWRTIFHRFPYFLTVSCLDLKRAEAPDEILGFPNTLADGPWTLLFQYGLNGQDNETVIPITFLPTGGIDFTLTSKDQLSAASRIL